MQGHLHEIDIRSILQLIEVGQRTGQLYVEPYASNTRQQSWASSPPHFSWFVFFLNGQIIYATRSAIGTERLLDHLQRYRIEVDPSTLISPSGISIHAPEYGSLWGLLESHLLTPAQGRSIIHSLVAETLFDLLSLHQGSFMFELGLPLAPQLITLETSPLVVTIIKQIQEWKQFHPLVQSPDQCLARGELQGLPEHLETETWDVLKQWLDGNYSLRRITRYLNQDILTVTRSLYPYIQQGMIQLTSPTFESSDPNPLPLLPVSSSPRPPRIACIDDSLSVRQALEITLTGYGYEVTSLGNPLKALGIMFQLKPNLILCDIAMPELDGYEICAMLRHSTLFRQIPIVMLTGKEGFIDRVRAQMVGATDYLTKPFSDDELRLLVEKYVGPGQISQEASTPSTLEEVLQELKP